MRTPWSLGLRLEHFLHIILLPVEQFVVPFFNARLIFFLSVFSLTWELERMNQELEGKVTALLEILIKSGIIHSPCW